MDRTQPSEGCNGSSNLPEGREGAEQVPRSPPKAKEGARAKVLARAGIASTSEARAEHYAPGLNPCLPAGRLVGTQESVGFNLLEAESLFGQVELIAGICYFTSMAKREFTAVFQKRPKGYIAWVEEIPGVNTQGRTKQEARTNLREALALILESNRDLAARHDRRVLREPLRIAIPA